MVVQTLSSIVALHSHWKHYTTRPHLNARICVLAANEPIISCTCDSSGSESSLSASSSTRKRTEDNDRALGGSPHSAVDNVLLSHKRQQAARCPNDNPQWLRRILQHLQIAVYPDSPDKGNTHRRVVELLSIMCVKPSEIPSLSHLYSVSPAP